jgi:DNA-binding XRE family transcriptional regulator
MASTVLAPQKLARSVRRSTTVKLAPSPKTMTTDAVTIIHNRFVAGRPELEAYVMEELERILFGNQIYDLRTKAGMTQSALARKIGMKAVDIDRLENADYEGHPLPTLRKIAAVFGMRIELNFVPLGKKKTKTAAKAKGKS